EHFAHLAVGVVAPFALVVAEAPQRRQLVLSGKQRVMLNNFAKGGAINKIIIHFASTRPEAAHILFFLPEIKNGAEGVVEENAVTFAAVAMQANIKRDVAVKRILVALVAVSVLPVIFVIPAAEVKLACLASK